MNRHFYILFAILAVFVLPHRASGQSTYGEQAFGLGISPAPFERVGMSGWQFLKIPTSARIGCKWVVWLPPSATAMPVLHSTIRLLQQMLKT